MTEILRYQSGGFYACAIKTRLKARKVALRPARVHVKHILHGFSARKIEAVRKLARPRDVVW